MKKILLYGIVLILSLFMGSPSAFAMAEVKSSAVVNSSTVTLGDLLDNLDQGRDIWVMNAPAPGKKIIISTRYLANLTKKHNVYWQNSRGIKQISVMRKGQSIKHSDLEYMIKQALLEQNANMKDQGIRFDTKNAILYLPGDRSVEDISVQDIQFNSRNNKFMAKVLVPTGDDSEKLATIRGHVRDISYVPVINKIIVPGRQITNQDISWISMATQRIGRNIVREKSQLIGMTPRRGLKQSAPIKISDLQRPKIINRGAIVSIQYRSGKISLTSIGKAIEGGARGDMIRVMNSKSHKTISAVVTGPNQVQVLAVNSGFAISTSSQLASAR